MALSCAFISLNLPHQILHFLLNYEQKGPFVCHFSALLGMDHDQTAQPSSHPLLTAAGAPGALEMPLTGLSGHLSFLSLLGIPHTLPGSAAPLPSLCHC